MLRLITITAAVILFPKIVSAQASVLATSSDLCVPATSSRIVTKRMKLISMMDRRQYKQVSRVEARCDCWVCRLHRARVGHASHAAKGAH